MRISQTARENFEFLLHTDLDMIGQGTKADACVIDSPEGKSSLECWYMFDTHGQHIPCKEAEDLRKVLRAKASWNLQVKLWAQDVAYGMILYQEELLSYCHQLPEWIFRATMQQAGSICVKIFGYVPRYSRVETLKSNVWFPYMDEFDPSI